MLTYIGPLMVVEDMARARAFYEDLLGQTVKFDFGENVQFEGGFSLHLKAHFQALLGGAETFPVCRRAHWGEIYFELDDLETLFQRLSNARVEFIHAIHEQPWGQRVMRFYDPDSHIIEVGESLQAVVWRFYQQGLPIEQISEKSSMPRTFVEQVIRERGQQ